jgi:hypothetical protein
MLELAASPAAPANFLTSTIWSSGLATPELWLGQR